MFCGTRDTARARLPAARRRAAEAGWDLTYVEEPDLIHVYPLLPFVPGGAGWRLAAGPLAFLGGAVAPHERAVAFADLDARTAYDVWRLRQDGLRGRAGLPLPRPRRPRRRARHPPRAAARRRRPGRLRAGARRRRRVADRAGAAGARRPRPRAWPTRWCGPPGRLPGPRRRARRAVAAARAGTPRSASRSAARSSSRTGSRTCRCGGVGPEQHLEGAAVAGGVEATDPHASPATRPCAAPGTLNDATVTRKAAGANRSRPKASPAAIAARPSPTPRPVRSRPAGHRRCRGRGPSYAQPRTRPSGPNDRARPAPRRPAARACRSRGPAGPRDRRRPGRRCCTAAGSARCRGPRRGPGSAVRPAGSRGREGHDAPPTSANRTPSAVSRRVASPRATSSSRWALVSRLARAALKRSRSASRALVAGPGQLAGDVVRRAGPAASTSRQSRSRCLVVREQLVDAGVRGRRDRAVRRQQREVGQPADLGEGGHEVAQRLRDRHRLEADRRRDRGQHVVAGEEQPGGAVGEDVVALRVAGGVHRVEGARPDLDRVVALEPGVGVAPSASGRAGARRRRGPLARRSSRAPADRSTASVGSASPGRVPWSRSSVGSLPEAEADVGAELARDHRASV